MRETVKKRTYRGDHGDVARGERGGASTGRPPAGQGESGERGGRRRARHDAAGIRRARRGAPGPGHEDGPPGAGGGQLDQIVAP